MAPPSVKSSPIPSTQGGLFRRHLPAYIAGALVLGVFQLSMNRIDWLSRSAINRIFGADPESAWQPALMMLGLAIVALFTRVASRWFIFNAGRDVEYEVRALLLDRLHVLGAAFYRKLSSGEIMSRATGDLAQVRLLFGFGVLNVINVVLAFISALQIMLRISPSLTLAALLPLPLVVISSRAFSKRLFTGMRQNQAMLGKLTDRVQANLAGVRVVRSFALEAFERVRFSRANRAYLSAGLRLSRVRGSMQPVLGSATAAGTLIVFWYGASLLLRGPAAGGITKGDFFAFSLALSRMTWPMIGIGFALSVVQRGRAAYSRLQEIFDAQPEVLDGPLALPRASAGGLVVRSLSFSHGARKVVDDVNFEVPPGGSLAIVGRTGSGKSTLAMLLSRLLPTPRGTVFVDGSDACDLTLFALRSVVGYAQQDAFLFSTTVSRNIGFPFDDPDSPESMVRIREAAGEAQVEGEVLSLPEQYDTVVGERGVQLSGGQKQRIALARALVWQPRVLILDDPLSAVDAKTEGAILEAIERQSQKRSVVLITHRVAAASRCDQIIVMEQGRVIERGTHAELVRNKGLYAAFAEEQQMAQELAELEGPSAEALSA